MLNDSKLLEIFLTKDRDMRLNCGQQFCHHRRNSRKVTRPMFPFPTMSERTGVDGGVEPVWIHGVDGWHVDGVDTERVAKSEVVVESSWVEIEVIRAIELSGIHKDRHHREVAESLRALDERGVPAMKSTHCWDESDRLPISSTFI